jgi:hypothetical protein
MVSLVVPRRTPITTARNESRDELELVLPASRGLTQVWLPMRAGRTSAEAFADDVALGERPGGRERRRRKG